jgi:hypothetical protein
MSHGECEVVIVAGQNGQPLRINKSDYDESPSDWTLLDPPAAEPVAAPAAPTGKILVDSVGSGAKRRFFLVDEAGARIEGEGIAADGYETEAKAWEATLALSAQQP